jgi:hypothetical protein
MERVLEAERTLGNRRRGDVVQLRELCVHVHEAFDELTRERVERGRGAVRGGLLEDPSHVLDVTVVQRREDGALVGEVLVERSDADARDLGDAVGGHGLRSMPLDHQPDRFEHGVHGLPCALLLRRVARDDSFGALHAARLVPMAGSSTRVREPSGQD